MLCLLLLLCVQKGKAVTGPDHPEHKLLMALKQALQTNRAAAEAFLKEVKAATGMCVRGKSARGCVV